MDLGYGRRSDHCNRTDDLLPCSGRGSDERRRARLGANDGRPAGGRHGIDPGPASLITLAGFALALLAVWLVSQSGGPSKKALVRLADVRMPLIAGLFFGVYFILIHIGSQHAVLWPLIAARAAGTIIVLVICAFQGEVRIPQKTVWSLIALNAFWDVGGNAFYILAGQVGRMDVAAVLGALYPGITVILAGIILREKLTRVQVGGIIMALVAIVLMTL